MYKFSCGEKTYQVHASVRCAKCNEICEW